MLPRQSAEPLHELGPKRNFALALLRSFKPKGWLVVVTGLMRHSCAQTVPLGSATIASKLTLLVVVVAITHLPSCASVSFASAKHIRVQHYPVIALAACESLAVKVL